MEGPDTRNSDFVRSLAKGLEVISSFGPERKEATVSEVATVTGLSRAATRRMLLTLVELGYATTDGRVFWLTPRILKLGYAYLSSQSLTEIAENHVQNLVAQVHESSSLGVLDEFDIVYVVRVPTKKIMRASISVGTRFPAFATSMGRVLLAQLEPADLDAFLESAKLEPLTQRTVTDRDQLREILTQISTQDYALTDQELEDGLRSIAVPIRDTQGRAIAALNVSSSAIVGDPADLIARFLEPLRTTARLIEHDLALATGRRHPSNARF
ncbi:IclR family transcriptional regulator C-terminal domain-containing protein [Ferrimicrobium sp.]|jgi:IclR family pca regulon transcriptional regulator|uniref:IclR family transcriptional regulator domain-containing protein n=1 Tax=Ferrimicrobium sp. TaxID=2926050 RepID=UPI00262191B4|nr:IclR family transcriptional regulator C-terminal domain-containing protein [Ferrimicrobium sp.]